MTAKTDPTPQALPHISGREGLIALSPVMVFVTLFLLVSLCVGDFYCIPLSLALLAASVWAIAITPRKPLTERIDTFSRAAGSPTVLYMVWIFILAGAFASLAEGIGAVHATVSLILHYLPPQLIAPGLFVASCLISMSIGTSVGTVVALGPLAGDLAVAGGGNAPLLAAAVLGGAFFGDNLSFISDTTIAATRTQGCRMNDKFKANIAIVLPAAIVALILYAIVGHDAVSAVTATPDHPWLILPYLLIIALAIAGINVTIVLTVGIISAIAAGIILATPILDMVKLMGQGIDSMGNLIIITLLATGMLGLIKANGGITWLLQRLTTHIRGARGAQAVIASLVSIVNICTANNTVAIITVGSISREIATRFGVTPRKTASLLDTCSCIVQCLIPYGAQTLLITNLAGLQPTDPWPYLYYAWALTVAVAVTVVVKRRNRPHPENFS